MRGARLGVVVIGVLSILKTLVVLAIYCWMLSVFVASAVIKTLLETARGSGLWYMPRCREEPVSSSIDLVDDFTLQSSLRALIGQCFEEFAAFLGHSRGMSNLPRQCFPSRTVVEARYW